jgi:hypothetical protein
MTARAFAASWQQPQPCSFRSRLHPAQRGSLPSQRNRDGAALVRWAGTAASGHVFGLRRSLRTLRSGALRCGSGRSGAGAAGFAVLAVAGFDACRRPRAYAVAGFAGSCHRLWVCRRSQAPRRAWPEPRASSAAFGRWLLLLQRFRHAARVVDGVRVLCPGRPRHHCHCQNACRQLHSDSYFTPAAGVAGLAPEGVDPPLAGSRS